jgi:hypothetical protein
MSMHEDLHCFPQSPQLLHFSESMTGAKKLRFEKNPRIVPTGHTVLQYDLPPTHANTKITTSVTAATMSVGSDFNQTSVL